MYVLYLIAIILFHIFFICFTYFSYFSRENYNKQHVIVGKIKTWGEKLDQKLVLGVLVINLPKVSSV